ncbi:2-oxoglutarate dehydrogenase complex dihydrolipoyllysine-residue succinyltransferase [Salinisphaera sp. USBA-960]|uniref:2-oxoglutarate dehydrogenase complex dihydrolipoyllysine-residue succinyltransferase n=1 Tax=Salinisphaera orenii TaxID=856731 RepID=UPI000DBE49AB|nr:2-oxoglutarate dehydrogenase complex dihydrolipoyllysine-residue succinyltransferase [Salifodinibacter halophilus]NNC26047.1 2-oxoglutarate dehydrogenase complex dihydrolipoyllysine-residue succinyltransferase [Salifodinibacter halophilus]
MATEVKVPELPESVTEASVGEWQKSAGDKVERDENLIDLETDKVVLETPAPADGVIAEIRASAGDTVHAGDVLALIDEGVSATGGDQAEAQPQPEASSATTEAASDDTASASASDVASPAARKIMDEGGVDSGDVSGSGRDGRITKDDANRAAAGESAGKADSAPAADGAAPKSDGQSATQGDAMGEQSAFAQNGEERREQRVPMTRIRKRIAERLLDASQNTAMLTTFNELDMQEVMSVRSRYKEQFQKQNDVKLGFMSFFVTAAVEALKRYPAVNASIDGGDIVYHGYYDIGLAVSSPRGLLVPILRDADTQSFAQIEGSVQDFGERAQSGKIGVDELTGGTFTITNGGIFGSYMSTPIVNPPQAAILGMHATRERPVVVDGEIQIRPIMMLALSYDHRLIDGREAVLFLRTIKEQLEDPARLLLQI